MGSKISAIERFIRERQFVFIRRGTGQFLKREFVTMYMVFITEPSLNPHSLVIHTTWDKGNFLGKNCCGKIHERLQI